MLLCEHYNLSLLLCYYKTDVWKRNLKAIDSWLEARTLRKKIVLLYSQAIIFLKGHKNGVPFLKTGFPFIPIKLATLLQEIK